MAPHSWSLGVLGAMLLVLSFQVSPSELIISIHRTGLSKLSGPEENDVVSCAGTEGLQSSLDAECSTLFSTGSNAVDSTHGSGTEGLHDNIETKLSMEEEGGELSNGTVVAFPKTSAAFYSFISASLVGLSGILPLLVLPNMEGGGRSLKEGDGAKNLNRLLSFAVGGLLGDVFLHLLPESWNHLENLDADGNHSHQPAVHNGLWVLFGLVSFCFLEKLFPDASSNDDTAETNYSIEGMNGCKDNCNVNENNNKAQNGNCVHEEYQKPISHQNGDANHLSNGQCKNQKITKNSSQQQRIKISGYLNLFANCIDNFTHGLAIGGSYLVSKWVGILTTMAILLHEIPHEVGDFAILLRAGFNRWKAAKLQMLTATGGLFGAMFAFLADSAKGAGDRVAWILPFTSGGFIYIALCTVVPDLLKETSLRESCIQMFLIISAISIMALVSLIE